MTHLFLSHLMPSLGRFAPLESRIISGGLFLALLHT